MNERQGVIRLPMTYPGKGRDKLLGFGMLAGDRLRVGWLNGLGRGSARAEDAQGTPAQSHASLSIF